MCTKSTLMCTKSKLMCKCTIVFNKVCYEYCWKERRADIITGTTLCNISIDIFLVLLPVHVLFLNEHIYRLLNLRYFGFKPAV